MINRRGTSSLKWDHYGDRDVIPLWVADMDFRSPPAVLKALRKAVDHGIFGYSLPSPGLQQVILEDLRTHFDWEVDPDWLVYLPGVVCGLHLAARAVGEPGDDQMILTPIYPPFFQATVEAGRNLLQVPLQQNTETSRWEIDFPLLEQSLTPRTRLLLLCNPHNPVGRVFSKEELERLARICLEHNIWICSDEIHNGLVLDMDKKHRPIATLGSEVARRTITLMAPSKTYNIPGLGLSFALIPDPILRRQFQRMMHGIVPYP
ncbi:MAG TPA: aminotransferase class I/II-fold pyridoxal phosphate-dependent enzyme, partial [Fibrobacteraceae bacterium]|nr:aminotransferase class I/II-fold pyridoxal phosphate-dependent enzyme [Fibrobacteraceae bacterium]